MALVEIKSGWGAVYWRGKEIPCVLKEGWWMMRVDPEDDELDSIHGPFATYQEAKTYQEADSWATPQRMEKEL